VEESDVEEGDVEEDDVEESDPAQAGPPCGSILKQADKQEGVPAGWTLCYIHNEGNSRNYKNYKCSSLVKNVAKRFKSYRSLLSAGGEFGCGLTEKGKLASGICANNKDQWKLKMRMATTAEATMAVCIKIPPVKPVNPPAKGGFTAWKAWSTCSAACGKGVQTRSRTCKGECNGCLSEVRTCEGKNCFAPGPGGSEWEAWGVCSAPCGGGERVRVKPGQPPVKEAEACNTEKCEEPCKDKVDIAFVLDSSESVKADNYELMKKFIVYLSSKFVVSPDSVHVGVMHYDYKPFLDWKISDSSVWSNEALAKKIMEIPYTKSGTRTDLALKEAEKVFFCGPECSRADAKKVLMVITDGRSNNYVSKKVTKNMKANGVRVVAVGIKNADMAELNRIASSPADVITISDFKYIYDKLNTLLRGACDRPAPTKAPVPPPTKAPVDPCAGMLCAIDLSNCPPEYQVKRGCCTVCDKPAPTLAPLPPTVLDPCSIVKCAPLTCAVQIQSGCCKICAPTEAPPTLPPLPTGNYGPWSKWTTCSKPCAGGEKTRTRVCPTGFACPGEAIEKLACNTEKCEEICKEKLDVGVILDASGSVQGPNFVLMKKFIVALTKKYSVSPAEVHFGAIHYSHWPYLDWKIEDASGFSNANIAAKFMGIPYIQGGTRTERALALAQSQFFCKGCGRPGVQKALVVLTDGKNNVPMNEQGAGKGLKDAGVKIITVGIKGAVQAELEQIASEKAGVFNIPDFDYLVDYLNKIVMLTCDRNWKGPVITPSGACVNKHRMCQTWARFRPSECLKNPNYMLRDCRQACGVC